MPSLQTRMDYALGQANQNIEANTAANAATALANAISASYTSPSAILTASDAGSDVSVVVAGHTRVYDDQTSIALTTDTITGLSYSTLYAFYYDDATRLVAAPTFIATTTVADARHNKVVGRHFLGQLTTPAAAGGPVGGGGEPPGGGDIP